MAALSAMRTILVALMLFSSAKAWSCSCDGISSIAEEIASSPILVEAQVVGFEEKNSPQYGRQVHSATLRITRKLKGLVKSEEIVIEHWMCYASLYPDLMKMRHTYVLPLYDPVDGRFQMAKCAHSGMELVGGKLYTFEQTHGAERRLQFYMTYADFLRTYQK
jgi:hypothetical protein